MIADYKSIALNFLLYNGAFLKKVEKTKKNTILTRG